MEPKRLRPTIASAQAGSSEAYQALLEWYGPRLFSYFIRSTGSYHDAEDLLSELMFRLVRRLKSYDDRGRFEPWLFSIAANMVRDRIRRRKASPSPVSLSIEDEFGGTLAETIAGDVPPAGTHLMEQEASADLQKALDRLDEATKQTILLRHFGQMSFREISELLDCPIGTVLTRVHRGLRTLRKYMGVDRANE